MEELLLSLTSNNKRIFNKKAGLNRCNLNNTITITHLFDLNQFWLTVGTDKKPLES